MNYSDESKEGCYSSHPSFLVEREEVREGRMIFLTLSSSVITRLKDWPSWALGKLFPHPQTPQILIIKSYFLVWLVILKVKVRCSQKWYTLSRVPVSIPTFSCADTKCRHHVYTHLQGACFNAHQPLASHSPWMYIISCGVLASSQVVPCQKIPQFRKANSEASFILLHAQKRGCRKVCSLTLGCSSRGLGTRGHHSTSGVSNLCQVSCCSPLQMALGESVHSLPPRHTRTSKVIPSTWPAANWSKAGISSSTRRSTQGTEKSYWRHKQSLILALPVVAHLCLVWSHCPATNSRHMHAWHYQSRRRCRHAPPELEILPGKNIFKYGVATSPCLYKAGKCFKNSYLTSLSVYKQNKTVYS